MLPNTFWISGIHYADIKMSFIRLIERTLDAYKEWLLDSDGKPVDVRSLIPVKIDEFSCVKKYRATDWLSEPVWNVAVPCQWISEQEAFAFWLKVSSPRRVARLKTVYSMSADHPKLGDMVLRDSPLTSVYWFISSELPEFAAWHGARILDQSGAALDFEALADEVVGESP